jgi:Flp pilus assembly protein TadD
MKSQFRCILFALIAVPAACGGDRSTPATSSGDSLVAKQAVTPPAIVKPDPMPEPAKSEPPKADPATPAPAVPTTYSETLAQGKAAAASGDHAHARELFEAAVKLNKKAVEPHIELSRLFIAMGERHLAVTAANKAIKLAPGSSQAYNTLGRAELARFGYDDAILAFRKATELAPDNLWAWNNLGFTHLQLKHYQEAADALIEATSRKGAEGYMWNNLGTAYEQLGQLDDARSAFENGGKLGSKEALASRKRLEGVKTIVVMKTDRPEVTKPGDSAKGKDTGYDLSEPMPDVVEGSDATKAMPEATDPDSKADDSTDEPADSPADDSAEKAKPDVAPAPPAAEKPATSSPL